jgi:pteridine reductase
MELRGKTALVTGAARRVGRLIALRLAREGASIVLHYNRSKDEAERTAGEIRALGAACSLVSADLTDAAAIDAMVRGLSSPVHVLVNSASTFFKTPLDELVRESDFDKLLDSNLKGPYLLSAALGKRMRGTGGAIVNIADWSGFRPYKDYAAYCASKGGLITLTKAFARDLGPSVRVNAVAPGPVMLPEDYSDAERDAIAKLTVLGRWGSGEDVASAVAFLVGNDFINGTVLVVDGGRSLL